MAGTANYHTDLLDGQPGDADTFNAPLRDLDEAITEIVAGLLTFASLSITGNLTVNGAIINALNATFNAVNANLTGDISVGDDASVGGDISVTGTLTSGAATINGALDLNGAIDVLGNIVGGGDITAPGTVSATKLVMGTLSALTIASGAFIVTRAIHTVANASGDAHDDLDTINGGSAGQVLILINSNPAETTHIRTGGNIRTPDGSEVELSAQQKVVILINDGTNWNVLNARTLKHLVGTAQALQSYSIASGVITVTDGRSVFTMDTEGSVALDDLTTISGLVKGQIIYATLTNTGREITIKHGTGNIQNRSGSDYILTGGQLVVYFYDGSNLLEVVGELPSLGLRTNSAFPSAEIKVTDLILPKGALIDGTNAYERELAMVVRPDLRDVVWGRAYGAAVVPVSGLVTPVGTGTAAILGNRSFVNYASGAVIGNKAGFETTFNIMSAAQNPNARFRVRTGAGAADINGGARIFFGLSGATLANSGSQANFIGFRFSPADADTTWQAICSAASTPTVVDTLVPANILDTTFELSFAVESGEVKFYINDVLVATISTNIPSAVLGVVGHMITNTAAARAIRVGSYYITHD